MNPSYACSDCGGLGWLLYSPIGERLDYESCDVRVSKAITHHPTPLRLCFLCVQGRGWDDNLALEDAYSRHWAWWQSKPEHWYSTGAFNDEAAGDFPEADKYAKWLSDGMPFMPLQQKEIEECRLAYMVSYGCDPVTGKACGVGMY